MRDQRIAGVPWKDLLPLSKREIAGELVLSLPWLAASLALAGFTRHGLALGCSFMFFLTGLRQVHGAFHYSLGLSRRATEFVMFVLSLLMLGSMHAIQLTHLRHHRLCMGDGDVEAESARQPAWKAIVLGPLFALRLHAVAFGAADRRRQKWMQAELAVNAIAVAVAVGSGWPWLRYHLIAMAAGHCLAAFFAVWTVHHDCDADGPMARTIRRAVSSRLTYDMFYHLEHHLFPAVPTRRLPALAARLDAAAPELTSRRVF